MKLNLETQLEVAIMAAEEACKKILSIYYGSFTKLEMKGNSSPLTMAITSSNDIISNMLLEHFSFPILSEEYKHLVHFHKRARWNSFWLIDPLNGTKEFLNKNGEFTVNIALIHKTTPVLGVVAVPITGEVYYSVRGGGAFVKQENLLKQLKTRTPLDINKPGLRVVASRSHMNEQAESFIAHLNNPNFVSAGSSLKFMAVVKGEADIYPRFIPSMEWDTAASQVIVNEVGLEIRNAFNKEPLHYNKENLLNPFFICN